jgi:hypothetical protein
MNAPKITLSNVHHMPSLSEETECFDAIVCVDGVRVCYASNRGQGGQTDLSPLPKNSHEDFLRKTAPLLAWAKTQPEHATDCDGPLMSVVDRALTDWLHAKDLARLIRTKFVLIEGGKVYTLKAQRQPLSIEGAAREEVTRKIGKMYPEAVLLNYLPQDDALARYIATARSAS